MPHAPVPVSNDAVTFKSCATGFFRQVRKGIELAEELPDSVKGLADDVKKAWKDSAKS
jgi:hypothetical protein